MDISSHSADIITPDVKPLYLPRKSNTLTYTAAPFPPFTCTISAPASPSDTCPLKTIEGIEGIPSLGGTPVGARVMQNQTFQGRGIDLQAIPNGLPAASLDALIAATQHVLDPYTSSMHVFPGDHYVTADGNDATVSQSFDVTLRYQVPTLEQAVTLGSEPCASLCAGSGIWEGSGAAAAGPGVHWTLFPVVRWQYTLPSGEPVAVDQGPFNSRPIDIAANWTGAWQVHMAPTLLPGALEEAATNELSQLIWSGGIDTGSVTATSADGTLVKITYPKTSLGGPNQTGLCTLSRRRHHRARQRGAPGAPLDSPGERTRIGDSAPVGFQVTSRRIREGVSIGHGGQEPRRILRHRASNTAHTG